MPNVLSVIWKIRDSDERQASWKGIAFVQAKTSSEPVAVETMQNDACDRRTEGQYFLDSICGYYTSSPIYLAIYTVSSIESYEMRETEKTHW